MSKNDIIALACITFALMLFIFLGIKNEEKKAEIVHPIHNKVPPIESIPDNLEVDHYYYRGIHYISFRNSKAAGHSDHIQIVNYTLDSIETRYAFEDALHVREQIDEAEDIKREVSNTAFKFK